MSEIKRCENCSKDEDLIRVGKDTFLCYDCFNSPREIDRGVEESSKRFEKEWERTWRETKNE